MAFEVLSSQAMWSLWLYCLFWESLPILKAHPVSPTVALGTNDSLRHWELNWIKYTIGLLGITITAFTLVGCLCCRKNRRPKGFQDCSGSINKEFKDGSSIDNDSSMPQMQGLELQVPANINIPERIQFESLPVERFVPDVCILPRPKPPPSTPSTFEEENQSDHPTLRNLYNEWFKKTDLHVPREKLKYLREIGHGWFGKVVEGCTELQGTKLGNLNVKNGNVVVRILTEEATAKEKAWFLGEATPYFKLRHRNILSLFGSCLEADPYLLLFESCPLSDLKGFLYTNQDPQSRMALINENIPTRIAIEIGAGLRHMHEHGFTHTDLSARNCLVASDLSIKLGDYGTGVEKYPEDYYILGDRALPIRWSAPETIECTETTIETREITTHANLWSYGVLLWEIAMWGKRPYDELGDEKVIEMLLSPNSGMKPIGSQLLLQNNDSCASNLLEAIKTCLVLESNKRFPLERVRHVLLKDQLESETSDFEQRWETLRPNSIKEQTRSASLQDLRGSIDSEQWQNLTQTSFRLGPEEPVKNVPGGLTRSKLPFRDSDSETEEESWRGRVERGAYTEKVKQKSKSVADLMVLVHIEPDSDADQSLGLPLPIMDKTTLGKKRLSVTGSDGDLPSAVFDDQFDLALRKLRDPLLPANSLRSSKNVLMSNTERPKLLTLTMDQGQTPILRLTLDSKTDNNKEILEKDFLKHFNKDADSKYTLIQSTKENLSPSLFQNHKEISRKESDLEKSIESKTSTCESEKFGTPTYFSNNFQVTDLDEDSGTDEAIKDDNRFAQNNLINMSSWNSTVDTALEQRKTDFNSFSTPSSVHKIDRVDEDTVTPSPQSRAEYSTEDAEDEFSNAEDLTGLSKRHLPMDEDDDRKRMTTPDDERSSDSGFRDKESCEEEESPLPGPLPNLISSRTNTPKSTTTHDSAEEEQLRILLELDTILDAEYYGTLNDSLYSNVNKSITQKDNDLETESSDTKHSPGGTTDKTQKEINQIDKSNSDDANLSFSAVHDSEITDLESGLLSSNNRSVSTDQDINMNATRTLGKNGNWMGTSIPDNEDEDSSTISLRSDNSYVSFGMDEEFVAAIRNELREKLPQAQKIIVETQELDDEEDEPSIISDIDSKNWEDEVEDLSDRSGTLDISIRYNTYGTPLSPIMEERETTSISEYTNVTRADSQDTTIVSKRGSGSLSEDDVLLIDTQTNQATLVEGISTYSQGAQVPLNHKTSDDNNRLTNIQHHQIRLPFPMDKRFDGTFSSNVGAPLPSPEDETCKWQQQLSAYPILPLQLQENLMSTSFVSEQDWNSNEDQSRYNESLTNEFNGENENEDVDNNKKKNYVDHDDDEDDVGEDVDDDDESEVGVMDEDDDDDDEDDNDDNDDDDDDDDDSNSSSSGEFIWQRCGTMHLENHETENSKQDKTNEVNDVDNDLDEDLETEDEEEFTPSAWDATLAPHRSALRSPDKTLKTRDQKKSVWFKKQRYHCVYEYPKETPPNENQNYAASVWEPTSYTDWQEMIDNIDRLNFQPMDYFETNSTRSEEEFYVSSSNRPFQFQAGNGKYVSQFFPGASGNGAPQEATNQDFQTQQNIEETQQEFFSDRQQLGELRHTRDRLKLNLLTSPPSSSNGGNSGNCNIRIIQLCNTVKQGIDEEDKDNVSDESGSEAEKMRLVDDKEEKEEHEGITKMEEKADEGNEKGTKLGEVRFCSESAKTHEEREVTTTTGDSESQVKTSPSDDLRNSDGLELINNYNDLDVE